MIEKKISTLIYETWLNMKKKVNLGILDFL